MGLFLFLFWAGGSLTRCFCSIRVCFSLSAVLLPHADSDLGCVSVYLSPTRPSSHALACLPVRSFFLRYMCYMRYSSYLRSNTVWW